MARVVIIADSETGELIDVAGNAREGGRYRKLAGRMLSPDGTQLDYGANGGDSITVSKSGGRGTAINLLADTVNVPGTLKVGGKTVSEIADVSAGAALGDVVGTPGQIAVQAVTITDPSTGNVRPGVRISLDAVILNKLSAVETAIGSLSGVVTRQNIADVVEGLSVEPSDTLDDIKGTLRVLLERLHELAEQN